MTRSNTRAIVLAAGRSTRFKTKKSKLLFNICGRTMVLYPIKVLEELGIPMTVVLGYQAEEVKQDIETANVPNVSYIIQEEQLGTGHAVACTQKTWDRDNILIMNGDLPLLTKDLIEKLIQEHQDKDATITFLTSLVIDPAGYGRVIQEDGKISIIEEKDCTPEQRFINCINAGIYLIKRDFLEKNISKLKRSTVSGELYLVDLVKMASDENHRVETISVPYDNVRGVNTLQELWGVEQIKRSEFIKLWMANGVRFELAQSIHIDIDVQIGAGSFIGTGVHLIGNTNVGEECSIGAFSILSNSVVGDNTTVHSHSVIQDSHIGSNVSVGPFARLRDNVTIGNDVEIGNFVEIKNTQIGDHARMKHLTYLGDAKLGKSVNVGAGTITCNYNGVEKHTTIIEDNAFIGSNNTLIAPVTVSTGAYTAGGSIITEDVPADSLAIGRAKQVNKIGYAKKLRDRFEKKTNNDNNNNDTCSPKNPENIITQEDVEFNFRGAVKSNDEYREEGF